MGAIIFGVMPEPLEIIVFAGIALIELSDFRCHGFGKGDQEFLGDFDIFTGEALL